MGRASRSFCGGCLGPELATPALDPQLTTQCHGDRDIESQGDVGTVSATRTGTVD